MSLLSENESIVFSCHPQTEALLDDPLTFRRCTSAAMEQNGKQAVAPTLLLPIVKEIQNKLSKVMEIANCVADSAGYKGYFFRGLQQVIDNFRESQEELEKKGSDLDLKYMEIVMGDFQFLEEQLAESREFLKVSEIAQTGNDCVETSYQMLEKSLISDIHLGLGILGNPQRILTKLSSTAAEDKELGYDLKLSLMHLRMSLEDDELFMTPTVDIISIDSKQESELDGTDAISRVLQPSSCLIPGSLITEMRNYLDRDYGRSTISSEVRLVFP